MTIFLAVTAKYAPNNASSEVPGIPCPHCQDGTMYRHAEWAMAIRLSGQAHSAEVRYVLDCFRRVYRTDTAAKRFRLTPELRLRLHQRRSEPVMTRLHGWLTEQFEQRKVEPNSSLGQAIKYLLNRWKKLTCSCGFRESPWITTSPREC